MFWEAFKKWEEGKLLYGEWLIMRVKAKLWDILTGWYQLLCWLAFYSYYNYII